jgi:hypothetical protein
MNERASKGKRRLSPARSDRELLSACLKGDAVAWEALVVRYQRLIYSTRIKLPADQALPDQQQAALWMVSSR